MVTAADDAWFDAFQQQMNDQFDALDARFDAFQQEMNARFDKIERAIWSVGGGIIVTLVGLLITQIIQGS